MATDNTTATLSPEVSTYYDRVFLARSEYDLVLKEGAQMRSHSKNEGRTVNFTRYEPLAIITTPITESCNPTVCAINACTVSVTLSEYGLTTTTSKLLSLVSIDKNFAEKISLVGQNMGETLNRLVRAELAGGTAVFANSHDTSDVAAGDTLSASVIRATTKTLEIANAMPYNDGMFRGKTTPQNKYSLLGDSTWINSKTYSDVKNLYKGEMGELYQVRWLLNKDVASANGDSSTAACAVTMYYTYVHGKEAFGAYDLEGDKPRLYILPNLLDSGSPAGRISKVSWAGTYATKLLRSAWVNVLKLTDA